jgi:hypothetical protein
VATKKRATKKRSAKKASSKGKSSAPKTSSSETTSPRRVARAKKNRNADGGAAKKKANMEALIRKRQRTGPTKAERRALRPTSRKPAAQESRKEIKSYFETPDREWTPELVEELKHVFLRAYARTGLASDGTLAAGITLRMYRTWRETDDEFAADCLDAERLAAEALEKEARRRAVEGYDSPVIYQGEITGTYRSYSDGLLTTLMKGNSPDKFRERVSTENKSTVQHAVSLDKETKTDVMKSILGMINNKPDPD